MTVVITLGEIIFIGIIVLITVIGLISFLIESLVNLFRKNCYHCKYWKLADVSGSGGYCYYRCEKQKIKGTVSREFNDSSYYKRCDEFEKE